MKSLIVPLLLASMSVAAAEQTISHGRFENIRIDAPTSDVGQFVMLLADSAAAESTQLARALSERGALVATIDTRAFFSNLERDGGECVSPDGDLENLSHYIQALQRLPTYHSPILVGDGIGAPFVYAMLAQAPKETFAGGISLRFCPELQLRKPLCKDHRLDFSTDKRGTAKLKAQTLERDWVALSVTNEGCASAAKAFVQSVTGAAPVAITSATRATQFATSYGNLAKTVRPTLALPPQQVADLPLIEVPATTPGDTFAVMFSGDGGWAGLDKDVAGAIAEKGIPVIGVDSLRYFWSERTPESLARDLERIVATYTQRWNRKRVVLIGYSQGADVLPFAVNRLAASTRAALASVVLIGLAERAQFEFHVGNWLGLDDDDGLPTEPEVKRIRATKLVCIYGEDDDDSDCDTHVGSRMRVIKLPGGHHFDGDYAGLAKVIVREGI